MSKLYVARNPRVAARGLDGEMMIMSGRDSTLFTLNKTATILWKAADGTTPLDDIVRQRICTEFDVEPTEALHDAEALARELASHEILQISEAAYLAIESASWRIPMTSLMLEMTEKALERNIPLGVQLDLTYRCNERCVHCYLDHDDHGEMTTAEIKNLLDQMAEAGVFILTLSGGEIFLRKDFFEILEYARRDLTFCVKLKTNAILIREHEAARIRELGVESIQISIYSHRPEVHDAITLVPGSLKRSLDAVRFLKSQGLRVVIANVLMAQNMQDYPGVRALAAELGVESTLDPTITPMMDGDRSILSLGVDQNAMRQVFRDASLVGDVEEFCAIPAPADENALAGSSLQRRPHDLLRFALRRRFSLCPVSSSDWKRKEAEIHRHLAAFGSDE